MQDEPLRLRALALLPEHAEGVVRELLSGCALDVEEDVVEWEGSHGHVHGCRVRVIVTEELRGRFTQRAAASDDLAAALGRAMAERPGHAVTDIVVEAGIPRDRPSDGPYRTPG